MSTPPPVDVVIATRDRPALLRSALRAVLTQTYAGPIRCQVVYDQSPIDPDVVHEVLGELAPADGTPPARRVLTMGNVRRPGLAGARNTGIEAGDADLVAFCDDDDEWLPTKLERQVAELQRTGRSTAVTGIVVAYDGHRTPRVPDEQSMTLPSLARRRVMEAHPSTVLVRREALADIGLVDEEIPGSYGEDFDWILRAAQHQPVAVVPEPLVVVRWGQSQFSRQWQVIIDAIDYGLAKHRFFHSDPRALGRLYGRRAFALAALGRRGEALREARRTVRTAPREPRGYLAAGVALHLVSAERLLDLAHRRGHGI